MTTDGYGYSEASIVMPGIKLFDAGLMAYPISVKKSFEFTCYDTAARNLLSRLLVLPARSDFRFVSDGKHKSKRLTGDVFIY
jgi:hypothetical protein